MTQPRTCLLITGQDADSFLQGLITNDINKLDQGMIYAAILTPQGKYLADFFLSRHGQDVLMDIDTSLAANLTQRLTMYKLRADVAITPIDLNMHRGIDATPPDGFADPRHPALGWRAYRDTPQAPDDTNWRALQVAHCVPQTGVELTPDSYILEVGFERLNGVDFRKGCYVGQEVTARMKHKTQLRKGLTTVTVNGPATPGTPITADGKPVGTLHTRAGDRAIAYLRFDRAGAAMMAGDANVIWNS